ncbi:glycoside hydrolase [Dunaliella salina]|uniref:Mannosyl-oligosaccharide glucosidase n=1 Tax=Dunaliella salina TaxID=3046 RepID=A0ABQ7FX49_DUNSA|nr:glycoside hydrolase [Dunaliella salina]|eukprot:KAF5826933.1 glycoside hydrolase [Dunaliella salina]
MGSRKKQQQQLQDSSDPVGKKPLHGNLLLLGGGGLLLAVAVLIALELSRAPDELRPLSAPRLTSLAEFGGDYKERMLWGSYRPGLYFGMRTRTPKGLLAGLLWFDPDTLDTLMNREMRHAATQEDELARYGWVRHDGEQYGRQTLVDKDCNISLTMVKHWGPESGRGGDWAVRVHARHADGSKPSQRRRRLSFAMYISDEDKPKSPWSVLPFGEPSDLKDGVHLVSGGSSVVGPWSFHAVESAHPEDGPPSGKQTRPVSKRARLDHLAVPATEGEYDLRLSVRELIMSIVYEQYQRHPDEGKFRLYLPNSASTGCNLGIFQVTVWLPGSVDFVFLSHKNPEGAGGPEDEARVAALSGDALTQLIANHEQRYDQHFEEVFSGPAGSEPLPEGQLEMAKAAVSNLIGSMGYFYGSSQVKTERGVKPAWDAPLFTAVPSRSFFPRGFLWDEGFHQLLVQRWSPKMSRDSIAHWLDLMNVQGWIPREQILGAEALERVPEEFVVQDPTHANPPSLFLPIANMAHQLQQEQGEAEELAAIKAFVSAAWPRLEAWYTWFNTSQAGKEPTSYRWHGRNATTQLELNPKTLASGLDDYPRASHPGTDERHLDLRCWMALASEAMAKIGTALGLPAHRVAPYIATHQALSDLGILNALHWDSELQMYLDWGLHTEEVKLQRRTYSAPAMRVATPPSLRHVPHFGYVSLFPLLMRLLPPDSRELGATLDHLANTDLLWTRFGLRSLAATSSMYKKHNTPSDKPYWRGQVWVNVNYLALRALKHYAGQQGGPYQEQAAALYAQLRAHILENLEVQYSGHGYLYEQYDDVNGRGSGSHPFNGWTALIALIAVEA